MRSALIPAALAATALVFSGAPASAQPFDHLKCYKISDQHSFTTLATLSTNDLQAAAFPDDTNCKISVHSKEFCIPVAKTRFFNPGNPKEPPMEALVGRDLANDFLCYKVRCDKPVVAPPASQVVHDQFGPRAVSGFRTAKVCTPAVKLSGGPYDEPVPYSALLRQVMLSGSSPREFVVDLMTSLDAEYMLTEITSLSGPAGFSIAGVEVAARRDCAVGSVALGASGACNQVWALRLTADPGTCTLNGSYQATFRYGCNPLMPNCSLVDFTLPDLQVNFTLASSNFCA